jgi:hypothetical protein
MRFKFSHRDFKQLQNGKLAYIVDVHAQEKQEENHQVARLEMNCTPLSPSEVQEDFICNVLNFLLRNTTGRQIILLSYREMVVVEIYFLS